MRFVEESLDSKKHFFIVGDFQCGADYPLNRFLSDDSFRYDEEGYGSSYLLLEEESKELLAFYTIKANGVQTYSSALKEFNSVPVVEIARIAVAYEFQHIGLGTKLFYEYILPRIRQVEELIAVRAVIVFVEADNEHGIKFYKSLGFKKAEDDVQRKIDESFIEDCDLYVLDLKV